MLDVKVLCWGMLDFGGVLEGSEYNRKKRVQERSAISWASD